MVDFSKHNASECTLCGPVVKRIIGLSKSLFDSLKAEDVSAPEALLASVILTNVIIDSMTESDAHGETPAEVIMYRQLGAELTKIGIRGLSQVLHEKHAESN